MTRLTLLVLVLTASASGALLSWLGAEPSLPWTQLYERALERSAKSRKPLLVYLYTESCTYCAAMERETFSDPTVIQEMGPRFNWVKLDAEKDPTGIRLREQHAVTNFPTVFILNPEAQEIDRLTGFLAPQKFRSQVDSYLHSPASLLALEHTVDLDPTAVEALYSLGQKYLIRGNYEKASEHFSEVLDQDPENRYLTTDAALYYLALARASSGQEVLALEAAKRLEVSFPDSGYVPDGAILAGQIHYYDGERQQAKEIFARYLDRFQNHHSHAWITQLLSEIEQEIRLAENSH